MDHIDSAQNPTIKLLRSLVLRKGREAEGLFIAEGFEMAMKARANGFEPRYVLMERSAAADPANSTILDWAGGQDTRIASVTTSLLSRLTGKENPQPLVFACPLRYHPLPETGTNGTSTSLVLAGIRDPGNLGTIIRTADATGVERVILVGASCDAFAPEAVRASTGSIFAVPIVKTQSDQFVDWAASWQGDRIGLDAKSGVTFRQPYRRPTLVMLGSESEGLPSEMRQVCTRLVRIPMRANVESLNIAAAAAVMLYELEGGAIDPAGPTRS